MKAASRIPWFLSVLKNHIRVETVHGQAYYQPLSEPAELRKFLKLLVLEYGDSPEECGEVLNLFKNPDARCALLDLITHLCDSIHSKQDEQEIRVALIAASLIASKLGPADFITLLGRIYRTAKGAHVPNPLQIFRDVAVLIDHSLDKLAVEGLQQFDKSETYRLIEGK